MEYSMPDPLDRKYLYRYGKAMSLAVAVSILNLFGLSFSGILGLVSIILYFIAFHGLRKSPAQSEGARAGFTKLFNAQWINLVASLLGAFAIGLFGVIGMGWLGIFIYAALALGVMWLMLKGWKEVQAYPPLAAATPEEPATTAL
jgi:hypothetical protein